MRQRCALRWPALGAAERRSRRRCSDRRRRTLLHDRQLEIELQVGHALRIDRRLVLHGAQHLAHDVDRLQQQVGDGARHLHAVAAQLVEQRLARVRERRDLGEAEGGAAALDRMRDAEDRVDDLRRRARRRSASAARPPSCRELRSSRRRRRHETVRGRAPWLSQQHPVHGRDQLRRIERLDDPAGRARGLAFALAVRASSRSSASGSACGGSRGSARSARITSKPSRHRHVHVEQHQVECGLCRESQRFFAVRCRCHFEAGAAERHPHHVAHRRRIVCSENAHHADAPGGRQAEQRFDAEQARSVAKDARVAEPLDFALVRGTVAHECAQQLHRGSVDALDLADVAASPARRHRGANTATASTRRHLSRCSCWRARSLAASGAAAAAASTTAATGAAVRLRFAFLVLIGLVRDKVSRIPLRYRHLAP